ncbi:ATP-binding cassette domain-containing protein [Terriglobus tenax]|uniref:ATP-binding cassette domain-containing protein n=1 Tax=Terriglobus tenax TaxID=1111115 RepID=UPI0021E037D3|nr:ATP-binding cassette domain-containing protein [Terriglobus tenax]
MSEVFLHERVSARIGTLHLDLMIALRAPWTVLFGPSGTGKSTVLRHLAGLVGGGAWRRQMPLAAQQPALFPHRTVRQNLTFGWGGETNAVRFEELVALFRLEDLLERYPSQISGGQAQRVNVARALMPQRSKLVLLDEPFTGLELSFRNELLLALRDWTRRNQLPVLMVTHEVADCLLLDAEVIKLHEGRVVAQGPACEVLAEERERLLASLR